MNRKKGNWQWLRTYSTRYSVELYKPFFWYKKGIIKTIKHDWSPVNRPGNDPKCVHVTVQIKLDGKEVECRGLINDQKAHLMLCDIHHVDPQQVKLEQLLKRSVGIQVVVRIDQCLRIDRLLDEQQFAD
jgi:hypothetical protein